MENLCKIKSISADFQNFIIAHERAMQIVGIRCKPENCTGIGGMEICGERNDENCETEKNKLIHTVINKDCGITVHQCRWTPK